MRPSTFDFVGRARRWAIISAVLLVTSIGSLLIGGLDLSIDFVGGTAYRLEGVAPGVGGDDLRLAAEDAGAEDVTAQIQGAVDEPSGAVVRTEATEPGSPEAQEVEAALREIGQPDDLQVTFVGPTWGQRLTAQALRALAVFLAVVVLYISFRLEFKMAVAAVVALAHDVLITLGLYALVGFNVSPATVIALLTILGYSLYDTVIVFDRVKENEQFLAEPGFRTYGQMVNTSMNEVLWRSVNTSVTSLLPVGALLLLGSQVFGATTLQDLSLALFLGMAVGVYSSIFVAGPLLAMWKSRDPEEVERAEKAARKLGKDRVNLGTHEAPVPEADPDTLLGVRAEVLAEVQAGSGATVDGMDEAAAEDAATERPVSRAPVTTEYVRGQRRRSRSQRKRR